MKKTTAYARKLKFQRTLKQRQDQHTSLVTQIQADLRGLQIDAGLHTWTGNDAAKMIDKTGRLCYVTGFAGKRAGFKPDHPDMRIMRGTVGALDGFVSDRDNADRYRPALQSGLAAIDRLLAECNVLDIIDACLGLDSLLCGDGVRASDMREAMGVAA